MEIPDGASPKKRQRAANNVLLSALPPKKRVQERHQPSEKRDADSQPFAAAEHFAATPATGLETPLPVSACCCDYYWRSVSGRRRASPLTKLHPERHGDPETASKASRVSTTSGCGLVAPRPNPCWRADLTAPCIVIRV
jgi:hypothetical protein